MGAEIKIYQSLWKNLLLVICCVIFAIGAIFIIADDSCKIMTKVCGGWLGVIFFGGGGLFICVTTFYNSIRHIPYFYYGIMFNLSNFLGSLHFETASYLYFSGETGL